MDSSSVVEAMSQMVLVVFVAGIAFCLAVIGLIYGAIYLWHHLGITWS